MPCRLAAQTSWYTVIGLGAPQFQYYDDGVGAAVWQVLVTVRNSQATATYLAASVSCGSFTAYSEWQDDYICPQPSAWGYTGSYVGGGQTATVPIQFYVSGSVTSGTMSVAVTGR